MSGYNSNIFLQNMQPPPKQMKLIIAGSRQLTDITEVNIAIQYAMKDGVIRAPITEVVCGMAKGADTLGKEWAEKHGIRVKEFPAHWERDGPSAGYRRNERMADYVFPLGSCIVIWDGQSKGSKHMIDIAKKKGIPCYVHHYKQNKNDTQQLPGLVP